MPAHRQRADQDRFAARSHQRAAAAWERGAFNAETMSVGLGAGSSSGRDAKRGVSAAGRPRRSTKMVVGKGTAKAERNSQAPSATKLSISTEQAWRIRGSNCATASPKSNNCRAMAYCGSPAMFRA